jgi:RNA polymerase sigma-70 factor (ECF subfamily)
MNYAEIAEVMGLSTKAVKSLLSRARAALRDALQAQLAADSTFLPFQQSQSTNGSADGE